MSDSDDDIAPPPSFPAFGSGASAAAPPPAAAPDSDSDEEQFQPPPQQQQQQTHQQQRVIDSDEEDAPPDEAPPAPASPAAATATASPGGPLRPGIKPPPSVASVLASGNGGAGTLVIGMTDAQQKRHDALNPKAPAFEDQAPPVRVRLLEGLLQKKSPKKLFTVYQERYFVLHSDKLEYWKTKEEHIAKKEPQGLIPLYAIKRVVNMATVKGKNTRFDVVIDGGRTFELQTNSPYECENWCKTINDALKELERHGLASQTAVMAGSAPAGAGGADANKFWKHTAKIESMLTAPLPVHMNSTGRHQAAQEEQERQRKAEEAAKREAQAARVAAIMRKPAGESAPAPAAAAASAAPAAQQHEEPAKKHSEFAKPAAASSSSSSSASAASSSSPAAPVSSFHSLALSDPVAPSPAPEPALSSLPPDLSLRALRSVSALGSLGSLLLAQHRQDAARFSSLHVVPRGGAGGAALDALAQQLHERMGALCSPFLPRMLFRGQCADASFAAFEPALRGGDSLLSCLSMHRRIPEAVVRRAAGQLVCLLGTLHSSSAPPDASGIQAPVLARSLSPESLSFDGAGRLCFLDPLLGLPSVRSRAAALAGAEDDEPIVPEYLTPEGAAAGASAEGPSADLWRLGVLCYELAVGIPPFRAALPPRGNTDARTYRRQKSAEIAARLAAHARDPLALKFPPFVSAEFQSFVRACLVPNQSARLGGSALDPAVRGHAWFSGVDWAELASGEPPREGVHEWMRDKVLGAPASASAAPAGSTPEQMHHSLPAASASWPAVQPTLYVRLLSARGMPAASGDGGWNALLSGSGESKQAVRLPGGAGSKGSAPSFPPAACFALASLQGGQEELTLELQSLAPGTGTIAARCFAALSPSALARVSRAIPGAHGVPEAQLAALISLALGDAHSLPPLVLPLASSTGLPQGEVSVSALWVTLGPLAPRVELQGPVAECFGPCDDLGAGGASPAAGARSVGSKAAAAGAAAVATPTWSTSGGLLDPVDLGRCTPPPAAEDAGGESDESDTEDDEAPPAPAAAAASSSSSAAPGLARQATAANLVRGLVSKKKVRFQRDGFDLDLTYITPRIIAMGFPSEGAEAVYRNPMEQVQRFFNQRHPGRARIYNLCSERTYDHAKFDHQCVHIPFNDHNAPAFGLMLPYCLDAHAWLAAHEDNVVAVHCKAGKGRTGTLISCQLLFEGHSADAEGAMHFFGAKRTANAKGVTIASQQRYVHYFAQWMDRHRNQTGALSLAMNAEPPRVALKLVRVRMHTVPNFDIGGGCDPYFKVKGPPPAEETLYDYQKALKKHGQKIQSCHDKGRTHIELLVPGTGSQWSAGPCDPLAGCIVAGDFKMCFMDEDTLGGDDSMFNIGLNTFFIPEDGHLVVPKSGCDKANKDKKCKHFDKDFQVELWFEKAQL